MNKKPEYIKELFKSIALTYDITNKVMSFGMSNRWRQEAAEAAAHVPRGRVMDFCCGTGDLCFRLAGLNQAEIVGIDYCGNMIARAAGKNSDNRIKFLEKDIYENGYPADYFDAVSATWGVRNTDDCIKTIKEMIRILRPGGRVVIVEMGKIKIKTLDRLYWSVFGVFVPVLGYIFTKKFEAYKYFYQSSEQFYSQYEMAEIMKGLGLKKIAIKNYLLGAVAMISAEK